MLVFRLLVSQSSTTMLVYRAEQVASLKHFLRSPNIVRTPLTTWFKRAAVKRWTQIRSRHLILKWHVEKRWTTLWLKLKHLSSQGDARPESRGRVGYRDESECWQWQSENLILLPEPKLCTRTQESKKRWGWPKNPKLSQLVVTEDRKLRRERDSLLQKRFFRGQRRGEGGRVTRCCNPSMSLLSQ